MIEFFNYTLLTPKRVGKSYLGVFIIGVGIFILMMLAGFLFGYIYNNTSINDIMQSEANLGIQRLYILPYNLLYGVYNKIWIAIIICTVLKVEEFKYALPKDILAMLTMHLKLILLLCLLISVITEIVIIGIDQISFEWGTEIIRYLIAPMIMVFFIFTMIKIIELNEGIKQALSSTITIFKDTKNLMNILSVFLTYVFC